MTSSSPVFSLISIVLAAMFTVVGGSKLAGAPSMRRMALHLGVPPLLDRLVGAAELLAVLGLLAGFWVAGLGMAASAGLVLLMIGAVFYHRRAGDELNRYMSVIVLGVLAAANILLLAIS